MIGNYLGSTEQEFTDKETGEKKPTRAHQFAPRNNPDDVTFLWGTHELNAAIDEGFAGEPVVIGTLMKIDYLGQVPIKNGARQLKRYRVQYA